MTEPFVSAVLLAAGSSNRMQGINKLYSYLAGQPVIAYSLAALKNTPAVAEVVIVAEESFHKNLRNIAQNLLGNLPFVLTTGGSTRQQSAYKGAMQASEEADYLLFHDAARPLVNAQDIQNAIRAAFVHKAVTLAVPSKDTVKLVAADGRVEATPERSKCYLVQTPQVFARALYLQAQEVAETKQEDYTDDCQLIEQLDVPVYIVAGHYKNIKITTQEDLALAALLLEDRKEEQTPWIIG